MKKIFVLLMIISSIVSMQEAYADFKKTKIAVLDFRLQGNDFRTEDMGKIVAEWLITAFVHEGRFEVIERKLLGEVLEEQKMVEAGIVTQDAASEIGKLLGVKVIISGSVAKLQDVVEVNARIVDVTSASIITAESVSSREVTSLRNLVREMANKIIKNFPLEGYVAHRSQNQVVIDLGRKSGVKPGMTFLAYKEGEIVKHPKTSKILYVTKVETGIIRIDTVQEEIASGRIIDEAEDHEINYGDMIKSSPNGRLTTLQRKTPSQTATIPSAGISRNDFLTDEMPSSNQNFTNQYSAKGLTSQGTALKKGFGRLFINSIPENARIRILNIAPKYTHGIVLPVGSYHLEVSSPGYQKETLWYTLEAGEEKTSVITLKKIKAPPIQSKPDYSSKYRKYFSMIRSDNSKQVKQGAVYLYKRHKSDRNVIDTASRVLSARFNEKPKNKHFVDGMAYLCRIIGDSGQKRYKSVLSKVSEKSKSRKLRSYATKNMRRL